jgi:hypothetical protein
MGSGSVIPQLPAGFTLGNSAGANGAGPPAPPPGFTLGNGTPPPAATTQTSLPTIGSAPSSAGRIARGVMQIPTDLPGVLGDAFDSVRQDIDSYTPEGRREHPILSRIGDVMDNAKEILLGGQSAGKPEGTRSGFLNPYTMMMLGAPGAEEALPAGIEKLEAAVNGVKAARAAKTAEAATGIAEVNPEQFVYREPTPAPQHGSPVKVGSPLDNATINRLPGGKDLSPDAVKTLKEHIGGTPGEEIEVGSTPKNTLLRAVGPVRKTLADTGVKLNEAVAQAPPFEHSIVQEGKIHEAIDGVIDNLPGGDEERLTKTVEKEMESADSALSSKDPKEVLAYRRKLGSQIDWNNIVKNPDTPGETQNLARAKIYRALTDKIHEEIPETVPLDKIFQPNLELQSHLDAKLGTALSRDPAEAEAQRASELEKGKRQLGDEAYNEVIAKNRRLAGMPESDVEASVRPAGIKTPVDETIDQTLNKFKVSPAERPALKQLIQPSVKAGKLYGTNTDWREALGSFDKLTPEQRAARFADPAAIRTVLQKQAHIQMAKAVVKYGSIAAAAHEMGIDRLILREMLSK